jgi:hypothetical protein
MWRGGLTPGVSAVTCGGGGVTRGGSSVTFWRLGAVRGGRWGLAFPAAVRAWVPGTFFEARGPAAPRRPELTHRASHRAVEASHRAVEASHRAVEASHLTVEASHRAVEASHRAVEASHLAVEASHRAVEASHRAVEASHLTSAPSRVAVAAPRPASVPSPCGDSPRHILAATSAVRGGRWGLAFPAAVRAPVPGAIFEARGPAALSSLAGRHAKRHMWQ